MNRADEGVAIIGMACLFPGAPNLASFWSNICAGVDAITEVPPGRFSKTFYEPGSRAADRFGCWRGGFIDAHPVFSPLKHAIMPVAARASEPDQLMVLDLVLDAIQDAGLDPTRLPNERTGVVLGKGNYPTPGQTRRAMFVWGAEQLVVALRDLFPGITETEIQRVKRDYQKQVDVARGEGLIGLVPNLTASRVAHRFNLKGAAYTVDAACASALIALERAYRELVEEKADLMLCGGVHLCQSEVFWSIFHGLKALSPSQQIRPFDRNADGLLIGEGIGILLLKRRRDALRDENRIYAIINAIESSSDGRGTSIISPNVEGQLLALERAWAAARNLEPQDIGLMEAHGTGTPVGDVAEIDTLRRFFGNAGDRPKVGIGSVKSMIGHAMPAAGAASMIKSALAIYHGVLPPTLHCSSPRQTLYETRFEPVVNARQWTDRYRITGVNAFGFGGINAHCILSAPLTPKKAASVRIIDDRTTPKGEKPLLFAADTKAELIDALERRRVGGKGFHRLAICEPTQKAFERAKRVVAHGRRVHGRLGIFYSPNAFIAEGGKVAFLFPGFDEHFEPRIEDLVGHIKIHGEPGLDAENTRWSRAIIRVNRVIFASFSRANIRPDLLAGHSIGEWSAMWAAGIIDDQCIQDLSASLPEFETERDITYISAGCDEKRALSVLSDMRNITISHDNCPHQVILCGPARELKTAITVLRRSGVICKELSFGSSIHSHYYEPDITRIASSLRACLIGSDRVFRSATVQNTRSRDEGLAALFRGASDAADRAVPPERGVEEVIKHALSQKKIFAPRCPIYSSTTCNKYPDQPDQIIQLCLEHLVKRVRFRELIEKLYADGVRIFVQTGTGSLAGFVADTLRGRPHLAVEGNVKDRSGIDQITRALAALWVEGAEPDFEKFLPAGPPSPSVEATSIGLSLDTPLLRFEKPIEVTWSEPAVQDFNSSNPATAAFRRNLHALYGFQREINRLSQSRQNPPVYTRAESNLWRATDDAGLNGPEADERIFRSRISLQSHPELTDHGFYYKPDWPDTTDHGSVVPMTGLLCLMQEAAQSMFPDQKLFAFENVIARRVLAVVPATDLEIRCRKIDESRINVELVSYASGIVRLGEHDFQGRPYNAPRLRNPRPSPIDAATLYADRWMFHGPRYQGIKAIGPVGDDGIIGELSCGDAMGALLDNAGQLLGAWIMLNSLQKCLPLPARIKRIRFHRPNPPAHARVECAVIIRDQKANQITADIQVAFEGSLWADIEGWQDALNPVDDRVWALCSKPKKTLLSDCRGDREVLFRDIHASSVAREYIAGWYIVGHERQALHGLAPRERRRWLNKRVAARDAVRNYYKNLDNRDLYPCQVLLRDLGRDRFRVIQPDDDPLEITSVMSDNDVSARVVPIDRAKLEANGFLSHISPPSDTTGSPLTLQSVAYDQLKIGECAAISKIFDQRDLYLFAATTSDINPIHLDERFAATSTFGRRVAHGMWSTGLISAVLGTLLPGPGSIYLGQSMKFLRPVFLGDKVKATVEVAAKDDRRKLVTFKCRVTNQRGETIATGLAEGIVPNTSSRVPAPTLPEIILRSKNRPSES
ncbi:MAG: polyketide synthase dehydratase domain-containing protein [Deltaproteobacteria bacterium]|nr:polyketide synthase dehydratase domain-containing protein [Deltaproteobacteria bacterium]